MSESLTLRSTVIAGHRLEDDYEVRWEGHEIGRIRLATEQSHKGIIWNWHINPPMPIPSWCNSSADCLEEAKEQFKAAWQRFREVTPESAFERAWETVRRAER